MEEHKPYTANQSDTSTTDKTGRDETLVELLSACLGDLQTQNAPAHQILKSKICSGFFEKNQGKRTLNKLADQILQTITGLEE